MGWEGVWATLIYIVPPQIQKRGNIWTPHPLFINENNERKRKGYTPVNYWVLRGRGWLKK